MKHIKKMKIDIDKKNFEVIPSVQYDSNTRFLHINLLNGSVPFNLTGCSVKISATKPDGTAIFNNCTIINGKEGFIEVELTEQMNAVSGILKCEFKIYDGSGVLTTKHFNIEVSASLTSKEIISSNEFKALTDALKVVQSIDNKADKEKVEKKFGEVYEQLDNIVRDKYVTPEDFGAIGDGENDDTEAVLKAFDYENVMLNGIYKITKEKIIRKKINIFGSGTLKVMSKNTRLEVLKLIGINDCTIKDITITTQRDKIEPPPENHTRITTLGSNVCGIWLEGVGNVTIENVKFFNTEYDIRCNSRGRDNENIKIINCYSENSSQSIYVDNMKNSLISSYTTKPAIDLGDGDHFIYFKTNNVNNITIENCNFVAPDSNFGCGLRFSNQNGIVNNITVVNCKIIANSFLNSSDISNKFINCEFIQIENVAIKPLDGVVGKFENCKIVGNGEVKLLVSYLDEHKVTFKNCELKGDIEFISGSLEMYNCIATTSIYTADNENKKTIIIMNSKIANGYAGYLIRCSDNLSSIVMNNYLDCKYVFTSYKANVGNIAINNIYTGNIPDDVDGGQNIKI